MESEELRRRRAVKRAKELLEKRPAKWRVILLNHDVFHLEGVREKEIIIIRTVLDEIRSEDIRMVQDFKFPPVVTKEIWCKKFGSSGFDTKEIS